MKLFKTKTIAISNQKGGVGKTTTAVNVAAYLAVTETPTLLIDMDPQANATSGIGIEVGSYKKSIYDLIIGNAKVKDCIQKTELEFLDVIPSSAQLVGAEVELVSMFSREKMLKEVLEEIDGKYKFVIIDSPPSLGLLTVNVLTAADSIIIPIQCEYFALEGLGKLLNTIKSVQKIHNPDLDIEGLLLTMFDSRLRLSNQVVEEVNKHFSDMVFDTIIQRNVRLSEAPSYGESIIKYDAASKGAANYLNLANEVMKKNKL